MFDADWFNVSRHTAVTQIEYPVAADVALVSVTDLKGRITYCNEAFIGVSGYRREELLGQAHNIVRHPDMPSEAFRDMWATVQSGRPWSGIVKNRRKNGDHYWVLANATPIRAGQQIVGYMSVRTGAARADIAAAEALYARLNAQAERGQGGLVLSAGHPARADLLGRGAAWARRAARWVGLGGVITFAACLAVEWLAREAVSPWVNVALAAATVGVVQAQAHWQVSRRLQAVTQHALQLAAGDLLAEPLAVEHNEWTDLQRALNQTGVNLRTVVSNCRTEIHNLQQAIVEIAVGNQDLSDRTVAQAGSLQQAASAMSAIHGNVRDSGAHAESGAALAQEASRVAERTNACVTDVSTAMTRIDESSRRIGEIIHVIEGIAFQTNILALNAAVEAARAGESGRGFAVVAAEVRHLAQRTSESAKEVRALIVEATERVAHGAEQTEAARQAMNEALASVDNVSGLLGQITTAQQTQQTGIAQVNDTVSHLDAITQQNAAMVEQLAASAAQLGRRVGEVESTMSLFRLSSSDRSVAELDAVALRKEGRAAHAS